MWKSVQNISDVLEKAPVNAGKGDECSIPDVYGKAIQFHLALKQDYNGQENERVVNTWRGLITLLALQKYYDLPLVWESVPMPPDKNLFCDSLKFVPEHFSIFTAPVQQWDGKTFHVLTWKKSGSVSEDLFLYSPATLVYPVADCLSVFSQFPEIKWFDQKNGFIAPESVLGESDKKIVAYWLKQSIDLIRKSAGRDNLSRQMVLGHLNRYRAGRAVLYRRSYATFWRRQCTSQQAVFGPDLLFQKFKRKYFQQMQLLEQIQGRWGGYIRFFAAQFRCAEILWQLPPRRWCFHDLHKEGQEWSIRLYPRSNQTARHGRVGSGEGLQNGGRRSGK